MDATCLQRMAVVRTSRASPSIIRSTRPTCLRPRRAPPLPNLGILGEEGVEEAVGEVRRLAAVVEAEVRAVRGEPRPAHGLELRRGRDGRELRGHAAGERLGLGEARELLEEDEEELMSETVMTDTQEECVVYNSSESDGDVSDLAEIEND